MRPKQYTQTHQHNFYNSIPFYSQKETQTHIQLFLLEFLSLSQLTMLYSSFAAVLFVLLFIIIIVCIAIVVLAPPLEVRAMDNYLGPWIVICFNAVVACLLQDVAGLPFPEEQLQHWDTVRPYKNRIVVLCCVIV